jgi:hypothetical protein
VALLKDERISAQKKGESIKKQDQKDNFLQNLLWKGGSHLVWNHHPNQEKAPTARFQVYDIHVPGDGHFDPCYPLNLLV